MSDHAKIVEHFIEAWCEGDLDRAMTCWSPDGTYELHLSSDLLPFAGPTSGRDNVRMQFERILADWDQLLFRPGPLRPDAHDAHVLHCTHEFLYRHKASGEQISGRCRFVWRVENNKIVSCSEYHDRARIEAFLRLLRSP